MKHLLVAVLVGLLAAPLPAWQARAETPRDRWIHPRGESYDPTRHYRDARGELYYHEENDIGGALGRIQIETGERVSVRVGLHARILARAERSRGALRPVLLWDADGDGRVDRGVDGRLEGTLAVWDAPALARLDFRTTRWQIGMLYEAGGTGARALDGRYLASADSRDAAFEIHTAPPPVATAPPPPAAVPPVSAPPLTPGLVVMRHREGAPLDLVAFEADPAAHFESFERLTRADDADDWTMDGSRGTLRTHFDREDLLLVRTQGGASLGLRWGDLAVERFLEDWLAVQRNGNGCYSSLETQLRNRDGTPTVVPNRLVYCPHQDLALFDAPDGYEIELLALSGDQAFESTEVGTSVADNLRLYIREIWPRQPSARGTGSIARNIGAGFRDAGRDLGDAVRHALSGTDERHLHTGRSDYRPSPISAVPLAAVELLRLRPIDAVGTLLAGVESGIQAGADLVSAASNGVLNPLLQTGVGLAHSPDAADTAGDWTGALLQAVVKNLPLGERSNGVLDLRGARYHDRGFEPTRYTRTDTQLNIDRAFTLIDGVTLRAIDIHNRNGCDGPCGIEPEPEPIPLPGDFAPETPWPVLGD